MKYFNCGILVLKQQNPQQGQIPQTPQSMMQMQPNWSNIQGTGNGSGSLQNAAAVNNNITSQIEAINAQQLTLQEQIRQSEQNLSAQHNVNIWIWLLKNDCFFFFFYLNLQFF